MSLSFPNACRSYDERGHRVRFWGHDSSLEIPFFVDVQVLRKLDPEAPTREAGYLRAFDGSRERIHAAARAVYSRGSRDAYLLTVENF